jgi:hypothetical protein
VFLECAQALAAKALARPGAGVDPQLTFVWTSLTARAPRAPELAALRTLHATESDTTKALTLVASTVMASDAAVMVR